MLRILLFFVVLIGWSLVTALGVLIAIHFFGVDSAAWTHITSWKSPPLIAGVLVLAASVVTTVCLNFLMAVVGSILAGRAEKRARPKPARAQSNRRTSL